MQFTLSLLTVIILFGSHAQALPSSWSRFYIEEDTFVVDGYIGCWTLAGLVQNAKGIKNIELNSQGGNLKVAKVMSEVIRKAGYSTYVANNSICYSSCGLLFQAGQERRAHPEAEFLYHYPTIQYMSKIHPSCFPNCQHSESAEAKGNTLQQEYFNLYFETLKNLGVSDQLLDQVLSHREVVFKARNMVGTGVINKESLTTDMTSKTGKNKMIYPQKPQKVCEKLGAAEPENKDF